MLACTLSVIQMKLGRSPRHLQPRGEHPSTIAPCQAATTLFFGDPVFPSATSSLTCKNIYSILLPLLSRE